MSIPTPPGALPPRVITDTPIGALASIGTKFKVFDIAESDGSAPASGNMDEEDHEGDVLSDYARVVVMDSAPSPRRTPVRAPIPAAKGTTFGAILESMKKPTAVAPAPIANEAATGPSLVAAMFNTRQ